ncbi:MAG: hypothetical protein U9R69_01490, partial [Thermodesulfobacteriota bacterium]|nr:hypothetical protein [Thermodesulfobacteriota bacterium]
QRLYKSNVCTKATSVQKQRLYKSNVCTKATSVQKQRLYKSNVSTITRQSRQNIFIDVVGNIPAVVYDRVRKWWGYLRTLRLYHKEATHGGNQKTTARFHLS